MKSAGSLFIAVTLLFSAGVRAQDAQAAPDAASATPDKAYASIVARNMFGLLPLPPPDTNPPAPPVEPPPKITPNGIMTIFGRLEALFKVANKGKPGQPAKDQAYILSKGERQDDIEVLEINQADAIVTFNNHGTIQELPLVVAANSTAPAAGPGGGPGPGNPAVGGSRQTMSSAAERAAVRRPTGKAASPGNPANPATTGSPSFNSGSANPAIYQPPIEANPMTPEQHVILIEAQRMKYLREGNPIANLLPPTPLTEQNIQENGSGVVPGTK